MFLPSNACCTKTDQQSSYDRESGGRFQNSEGSIIDATSLSLVVTMTLLPLALPLSLKGDCKLFQ